MTIDIITLFPDMFSGPFDESIIKRAQEKSLTTITIHNLRTWALDERGTVDDRPYGGGTGMLLRPEPIFRAVEALKKSSDASHPFSENTKPKAENRKLKTVLLDAGGTVYNQKKAQEYSQLDHLILLCGHYEGVDYRVHEHLVDEVISIGDYVLTGGEIPAMAVVDSVVRLIPGVLEKEDATQIESFSDQLSAVSNQTKTNQTSETQNRKLLEFPQYTRPDEFLGYKVPEIVTSGNHAEIDKWRKEEAMKRTKKNRPDL